MLVCARLSVLHIIAALKVAMPIANEIFIGFLNL